MGCVGNPCTDKGRFWPFQGLLLGSEGLFREFAGNLKIARGDRKRPERLGIASDNVFSYKKWVSNLFRGHQSISGVRGQSRLSGDRCVTKLPAKPGKGPRGLEMPWYIIFHIKNEYQTCFGVTSPFRGLAGNLGRWIAREDRKRPERLGNASDNVFSYKKWVSNLFRGHQSISWGRRVIGSAGLTAGHRKRPMSEETSRTRKRPHKARFWIRGPLVCTKLHQRVSTKVPSQQNMSLTKNQFFQFRLGAYVGRNERNQNCRFLF